MLLTTVLVLGCDSNSGDDEDTATDGIDDTDVDSTPDIVDEDTTLAENQCTVDADCDDSDDCTADTCDEFGDCHHDPVDEDEDGYPAAEVDGTTCTGGTDCDDTDDSIHPDAAIDCTGTVDADCDGLDDPDEDEDGYTSGECTGGDDCDDGDADAFPGSLSLDCALDRDCNGRTDADNDDDGHDSTACGGGDCDDANAAVNPSVSELVCNGLDDDCNGEMTITEDEDLDGHANETCVATGHEPDCHDTDSTIHPGAPESCDLIDSDCDGDLLDATDADDDSDGYLDVTCGGDDCDDTLDTIYPGAPELCEDGVDQDCDTLVDGPLPASSDIRISSVPDRSQGMIIDWSGSEFGVGWSDVRHGTHEVYFARVATDGSLIGSEVRVTDYAEARYLTDLVWSGSEYALTWTDTRWAEYAVYLARLDPTGSKVSSDILVAGGTIKSGYSNLAWTGSEYGISWDDERDSAEEEIYFARLTPLGSKIGSDVRITNHTGWSRYADLVWTGSEFGVGWSDSRNGMQEGFFARISADGVKQTSDIFFTGSRGSGFSPPDVIWTGSEFGVTYDNDPDGDWHMEIFFMRLSADGTPVGTDVRVTDHPAESWSGSLAWSGSFYYLGWQDERDGNWEIYITLLSGDGVMLFPSTRLTTDAAHSDIPALVTTGSELGLFWEDSRDAQSEIYYKQIGFCD